MIDGLARDFEKEHPGIKVTPIYAGNYDDARIKALAALKAGQPAQISVLYSIDIYELLEQDIIVSWDSVATTADDKAWLKAFYPALMLNGIYKGKVYGIPFSARRSCCTGIRRRSRKLVSTLTSRPPPGAK